MPRLRAPAGRLPDGQQALPSSPRVAGGEFLATGFVGLGQHDLRTDRRGIEVRQQVDIGFTKAAPRIDQNIDPAKVGTPPEIRMNERRPCRNLGLGGRRVAVTGHIDEHHIPLLVARLSRKEDQLLRSARRARCSRKAIGVGQRIDEAGFSDIGAANKSDLIGPHRRQGRDGGQQRKRIATW